MLPYVVFQAARGRVFSEIMRFFCNLVNSENPKFGGHEAALQDLSIYQSHILGE